MILKIIYVVILLCLIFSIQSRKKPNKVERFDLNPFGSNSGASNQSTWRRSAIYEDSEERLKLEAADAMKRMWENGKANLNSDGSGHLDQRKNCGPRESEWNENRKCGDCLLDDCTTYGPAGNQAGGWTRGEKLLEYWTKRRTELSDSIYGPGNSSCPTSVTPLPGTLCRQIKDTEDESAKWDAEYASYVDANGNAVGNYAAALTDKTTATAALTEAQEDAWGGGGTIDNFADGSNKGQNYLTALSDKVQAEKDYYGYYDNAVYVEGSKDRLDNLNNTKDTYQTNYEEKNDAIFALEEIIKCNMVQLTEEDKKDFITRKGEIINYLPDKVLHQNALNQGSLANCIVPVTNSPSDGGGGGGGGGINLPNPRAVLEDALGTLENTAQDIGKGIENGVDELVSGLENVGEYATRQINRFVKDPGQFAENVIDATPYGDLSDLANQAANQIGEMVDNVTDEVMKLPDNKEKLRDALKRCSKEKCRQTCRNKFDGNNDMIEICKTKCDDFWSANPGGPTNCGLFSQTTNWDYRTSN